jgi:hypothetical protein
LVVFNRLLEVELHETLFNVALKERHGKRWASARYDGRVRRRAGRLLEAGTGAWSDLLDSLSWSSVDLSDVVEGCTRADAGLWLPLLRRCARRELGGGRAQRHGHARSRIRRSAPIAPDTAHHGCSRGHNASSASTVDR